MEFTQTRPIFDSSTLILIAKIELLHPFLKSIGMEAAIPDAVEEECCGGKKTLDALMIRKALDDARVKVRSVRDQELVAKLEQDFTMGRGESEAIALALEQKALLVAIDDKNGINACKLAGIPFTTAIGILIRSRQKGLIDRADAIEKLSALARFGRYKNTILEDAKLRLDDQIKEQP
jgi:predicted nucleic acid-binding protein